MLINMRLFFLLFFTIAFTHGQSSAGFPDSLYNALQFRDIGPFRGGRSAAVCGVPQQPMTFYFGGTGGGVWKSDNGGQSWHNISDGFFGGSIGAVTVSEWDNNVIYAGGGEKTVRGNVSHGDGIWKSVDAGKTWTHMGLEDTRHIPRIRVHPRNPDVVYVAALGHLFGPNRQRGIFRSMDGGKTWENILFVNENAGAVDLIMDLSNPRILYATFWRVRRTPYSLESGGEGSGLWKSTNGGDSWTNISRNKGLPPGMLGIIGVSVSPVNPQRVWAIIENKDGGVFRSDDGGETWRRVNDERNLRQRAWYYTRIYADTQNEDRVYVLNVGFWRSNDGGKSYERIRTPHGDHHDLWIDPNDNRRMVIADDGGAQVTFNGGESWSTYHNQPTAQFYRVTTDNHFPYRIYGAQQDNSTVRILHRSDGYGIDEGDWEPTAGGESGHIAPKPDDPEIVYGGSYGGFLERYDHRSKQQRLVDVWPDNPMGHGAKNLRYRFQWNFPVFFSPHDPNTLYAAGNVLFKTTNEGQTWEPVSPDLTRNDTTKLGPSGGPITKDNTSVEYYCTIFAALESPHEAGVLWAGSDDGLIHISRDNGKNWQNVTPPKRIMPEWIQINSIEADPFNPGGLYVAATMYKSDDFRPYLYKTKDYGKSWTKITDGIDPLHFTRVIRADPGRQGLLYAGTENGLYISFDDGSSWKPFQQNLPVVPVTDLAVKNHDLIVATQGRSFWVLDDLTPLHQMRSALADRPSVLFKPRDTYRIGAGGGSDDEGKNPPDGVLKHYLLNGKVDSSALALKILEKDGDVIKVFKPGDKENGMPAEKGMNRFAWDTRYPDAEDFEGLVMWFGSTRGPRAVTGQYRARLVNGSDSSDVAFTILPDPRSSVSQEGRQKKFDFLIGIRDKLTEIHSTIKEIRMLRAQVNTLTEKLEKQNTGHEAIAEEAKILLQKTEDIEKALYQTKNQSPQDPLNFPIHLNNKLSTVGVMTAAGDFPPTDQAYAVRDSLFAQIDPLLEQFRTIVKEDVPAFNSFVAEQAIPAIKLD